MCAPACQPTHHDDNAQGRVDLVDKGAAIGLGHSLHFGEELLGGVALNFRKWVVRHEAAHKNLRTSQRSKSPAGAVEATLLEASWRFALRALPPRWHPSQSGPCTAQKHENAMAFYENPVPNRPHARRGEMTPPFDTYKSGKDNDADGNKDDGDAGNVRAGPQGVCARTLHTLCSGEVVVRKRRLTLQRRHAMSEQSRQSVNQSDCNRNKSAITVTVALVIWPMTLRRLSLSRSSKRARANDERTV